MEEFFRGRGLAVDEWIKEVGGGMNLKREKLHALMDQIERREVGFVVIARTFSCRLHGLRRYEKTLKDELAGGSR